MFDVRPDSYAAWLTSLKPGDEVVIRYFWVSGRPSCRAWVESVSERGITIHWMTFDDPENGIRKNKARFTLPGGGNTHARIEHPTRPSDYHIKLGYEFNDRIDHFLAERMEGNPI